MSDNVAITAGAGVTIAADDIAGVQHQRVKLSLGADGVAVDAGAGAGAVGTDTQRVTLGSNDPAVATLGAVADAAATQGSTGSVSAKLRTATSQLERIALSLEILDDADETDRLKVNLIAGQAGIAAGAGAVTAATVRTVAASSATGTQSSVAASATDVTVLASNADRRGASVYNDSSVILYLLLANATSSATAYTVKMQPDDYFEVPFGYTGIIKGIWASATGSTRVTELT